MAIHGDLRDEAFCQHLVSRAVDDMGGLDIVVNNAGRQQTKASILDTLDPAKGYRIEDLGRGLYMVSEGAYQSMFLVYETGVVVVDAPPTYAASASA